MLAKAPISRELTWEEFVDDIQGAIWDYCTRGKHHIRDVAAEAHLSVATVSRFISRETKHPRHETVLSLAYIAGYEQRWVNRGSAPLRGEVNLRRFRTVGPRKK